MIIRCAVCVIFMAMPALAEWKRYLHTFDGAEGRNDSPPAHDLAYFRRHPCSRIDPNDRILQCVETPSEIEARLKTHTTVRLVGSIGAFTVYELLYFSGPDSPPFLRTVLVETTPNQLHEIEVQEAASPMGLSSTDILRIGQESIVRVAFDDGGMDRLIYEDDIIISQDGTVLLNFEPVYKAVSLAMPKGMDTYQPTTKIDFENLLFTIETEKSSRNVGAKMACCEGRIEVPFVIKEGRVIAGKGKYFP